jgi:hypothetical protein
MKRDIEVESNDAENVANIDVEIDDEFTGLGFVFDEIGFIDEETGVSETSDIVANPYAFGSEANDPPQDIRNGRNLPSHDFVPYTGYTNNQRASKQR